MDTIALLPFPASRGFAPELPKTVPFLACGAPAHIADAFGRGAADYLCDPWTEDELAARLRRVGLKALQTFPGAEAVLRGTRLTGPAGARDLSFEEAAILRMLHRQKNEALSREALRRVLWPRAGADSRVVDESVSRLRSRLRAAGISSSSMDIRSVRGFGYRLVLAE